MTHSSITDGNSKLYQLDGRVPLIKALPFGLQHVLAMFVSNITPIVILTGIIGVDSDLSAILIKNCMIIAGIGTYGSLIGAVIIGGLVEGFLGLFARYWMRIITPKEPTRLPVVRAQPISLL